MQNKEFVNAAFEHDQEAGTNDLNKTERVLRRVNSTTPVVPLTFSWRDVNVYAEVTRPCCGSSRGGQSSDGKGKTPGKHILMNVSGVCRPGELLALMGASGAGKTTLLNVLTGRSGDSLRVSGELHVNGELVRPSQLVSHSAYVQQEDLFVGTLTVKEQLVFQALLRMDRHLSREERMVIVQDVMEELSLVRCQDTLIGISGRIKGISGGETKRLAFACEMLTNPPLMFCDEPTTGLDSFMAQTIVEAMRKMTQRGRTVISTIHQPSSQVFMLFDRVLLLAEGRTAFLGQTTDAKAFLLRNGRICPSNFNPADFFISCLAVHPDDEEGSRAFISGLCDDYDANEGRAILKLVHDNTLGSNGDQVAGHYKGAKSPYKASWWSQFSAVLVRCNLQVIREPMLLQAKLIQVVMTAVLLGLIYLKQDYDQSGIKNLNSILFLLLTNMTFQNVFGAVQVFCTDMEIFKREHDNGMYRIDVFFIAKSVSEIPITLLQPMLFVSVIYFIVGLNPAVESFFTCMGIIVLVANCGVSFSYFISCLSKNLDMALAISAPLIIPFMLFGGFFLNSDSVPVYFVWLQYISWFNYGNEALIINQWRNIDYIKCDNSTDPTLCINNGQDMLDSLNYEEENLGMDLGAMCALVVGFRLIAFGLLYAKVYKKKDKA